jgi:hypothetical protein
MGASGGFQVGGRNRLRPYEAKTHHPSLITLILPCRVMR